MQGPLEEMPPPLVQQESELPTVQDKPKTRKGLIKALALITGTGLFLAAVATVFINSSGEDGSIAQPTPTSSAETSQTQPPATAAPGSTSPGVDTFAQVSVDECSTILGPIGADNPFGTGRPFVKGSEPKLQGSGLYSDPTWFIELSDTFDASSLVSDPRPASPSVLNGVSDGQVLLFAPFSPNEGSKLGVYRIDTGDMVWSTSIAPEVYPLVDTDRLYLIDRRSPDRVNIAIVAPSRAQITACFSATGSPLPTPSPVDRTAVASKGVLYVVFNSSNKGGRIEALSESGMTVLAQNKPYPLQLHGVLGDDESGVLVSSHGNGQSMVIDGLDLSPAARNFSITSKEILAAPTPAQWGSKNSPTNDYASPTEGLVPVEIQSSLYTGKNMVMLAGTNGQDVLMFALSSSGTVMWKGAAIPEIAPGMSASGEVLHLARTYSVPRDGPRTAALVSFATGEVLGTATNLKVSPALGNDLIVHSTWPGDSKQFIAVYEGEKLVGSVSGPTATAVDPVASSKSILVVFSEVAGKRYLAAFVLDPTGEKPPSS